MSTDRLRLFRRTWVTHRTFYFGFISIFAFIGALLGVMNSWLQLYLIQHGGLHWSDSATLLKIAIVLLLCFIPVIVATLIYTNRIVGPLRRLQRHMEGASQGDVPPDFRFRKGDLLREIEGPYNKLLERLRTIEAEMKKKNA